MNIVICWFQRTPNKAQQDRIHIIQDMLLIGMLDKGEAYCGHFKAFISWPYIIIYTGNDSLVFCVCTKASDK